MHSFKRLWSLTGSVKCFKSFSSVHFCFYQPQKSIKIQPAIKFHSPNKRCSMNFHISRPSSALPPLIWITIQPVIKVFGTLFGRRIRKWWQRLPKNRKRNFVEAMVQRKYTVLGSCIAFCGACCGYYFYHLEENPLTKRKRFILFTNEQLMELTSLLVTIEIEKNKDNILPIKHPSCKRVERVVARLVDGNKDLPEVKDNTWLITIIDNSDKIDAFVFLNGHIFVFTGLLKLCDNDDKLGAIIGHEMAHAILGHVGEKLSNAHVVEMLFIIPVVLLWTVFPYSAALILQTISTYIVQLMIELPYDRSIEREADEVGLQLAAKSCFDVRQASAFWKHMSEIDPTDEETEFLSTHPSHLHRKEYLEQLIPPALQLRKLCKCPDLK